MKDCQQTCGSFLIPAGIVRFEPARQASFIYGRSGQDWRLPNTWDVVIFVVVPHFSSRPRWTRRVLRRATKRLDRKTRRPKSNPSAVCCPFLLLLLLLLPRTIKFGNVLIKRKSNYYFPPAFVYPVCQGAGFGFNRLVCSAVHRPPFALARDAGWSNMPFNTFAALCVCVYDFLSPRVCVCIIAPSSSTEKNTHTLLP